MPGGGTEKIIPMTIGIVTFVVLLATLFSMSSMQQTMDSNQKYANPNVPEGSSLFQSNLTVDWLLAPGSFDPVSNAMVSNTYYDTEGAQKLGTPNFLYQRWIDPNYDNHFLDLRFIVNSTDYDPTQTLSNNNPARFESYIMFDGYTSNLGGIWIDKAWQDVVSYDGILSAKQDYYTSVFTLSSYNISVIISTGDPFVPFLNRSLESGLLYNNYSVSISQLLPPAGGPDVWSVAWWLLTMDTRWLPGAPFIAALVTLIVDFSILLIVVKIIQGFIP